MAAPAPRAVVFTFNFVTLMIGIVILLMGLTIYVTLTERPKIETTKENLDILLWITRGMIGAGLFVAIISFCGCCGALAHSIFILNVYMCLLTVLMGLQLVLIFSRMFYNEQIMNYHRNLFDNAIKNYDNATVQIYIDDFQIQRKCCGLDGPADYTNSTIKTIPTSCCGLRNGTCESSEIYHQGCWVKYEKQLKEDSTRFFVSLLVSIIIELIVLFLTNYTLNHIIITHTPPAQAATSGIVT